MLIEQWGRKVEDKEINGSKNRRTVRRWTEASLSMCLSIHRSLSLCVLFSVPDEPPVILGVKPTTTTSVLVQWKVGKVETDYQY